MRKILLFLILLMLPIFSLSAADVTFKTKVNSARECAVCHYEMLKIFIETKQGTPIAPYSNFKEVADEKMCFSCHNGSVLDSRDRVWNAIHKNHKTGVELKKDMKQKKPLPLVDNKITCATCHTPHGVDDRGIDDINNSRFLRQYNDKSDLCINCHEDKTTKADHPLKEVDKIYQKSILESKGKISKDNKVLCESCHEIHGSSYDNLTIIDNGNLALCNTCHEDLSVKNSKDRLAIQPHTTNAQLSDKILTILNKEGRKLFKNKLSCFTCHDVHNAKGITLLNVEKKDTAYCYRCHDGYEKMEDSSHNLADQKDFKTPDGKTVSEVNLCGACHGGHKFRFDKKFVNNDNPERICETCHNQKATVTEASGRYIDPKLSNHFTGDIAEAITSKRIKVTNYKDLENSIKEYINNYTLAKKSLQIVNKGKKITCTSCHDIHGDKPLFLRKPVESGELCLSCHFNKTEAMKSGHGDKKLTETCVSCHKLHNNNNAKLIRNFDKDDGCLSCHKESKIFIDKYDGEAKKMMFEPMPENLVFTGFNHPTAIDNKTIFADPMNNQNNGRFSCVTCHDPHISGDKPYEKSFLRLDKKMKDMNDFCVRCHTNEKDIIGSDHDITAVKKVVVNKRTGRIASTCDNCHKTHNADTEKNIFNKKDIVKNDDICLSCHKKDGDAKEKFIDIDKGHKLGLIEKVNDNISKTFLAFNKKGQVFLECRTCHNPHKNVVKFDTEGDMSNSFLNLPTEQTVCLNCHMDKKSLIGGGHDINNAKNKDSKRKAKIKINDYCSECHTTHNSDSSFLMKGATSDERCNECHKTGGRSEDAISSSHMAEVEMKEKNRKNLPLVDKKIACITCHDSHSMKAKLARAETARIDDLCLACHDEQSPVMVSPHNMQLAKIKDKKMIDKTVTDACIACHLAHNFDKDSYKMTVSKSTGISRAIEESCLSCHSSSGIATTVPKNLRHSSMMRGLENIKTFEKFLYDTKGKPFNKGIVDCSTCHDPHVWSNLKDRRSVVGSDNITGDNFTSFLKADVDKEFCSLCHEDVGEWFYNFHTDLEREKRKEMRRPDTLFNRILKSSRKE